LRANGTRQHRPSAVTTIYSDDHGETWKSGEIITQHGDMVQEHEVVNPSETVIVELADGRVMVNMRNESEPHRRLVAYSEDGATGWSTPVFHEQLLEPVCMGSIVRLTQQPESDRNRILFVNPNNLFTSEETSSGPNAERRNVTVKLSYDEGENWPVSKVLEPGISGYTDVAVGNDGTIYCIYENGGLGSHYSPKSLTVAKFNLAWLTEGSDKIQEMYK
jgi:sialidase-1